MTFSPSSVSPKSLMLAFLVGSASLVLQAEPTNAFFPLMAWNHAPSDEATFRKMRECGLTVAGFVSPKDLDLCHAAGLRAIISDRRVSGYDWMNVDEAVARQNITSLVAEVGKHPAVYGYYLIDEPGRRLFPGLGKVAALVRELAPGKWPYINLFPNYANAQQLGTETYSDYLEQFVSLCKPTELSYDHYALMDDGSLRHGYWQNLQQMRSAARASRLPFWNIVLTVAHFNYREPTAADLKFQVYTTLAYGGRGIAYFTYFAPSVGNYRMAPIDQFGNPTASWSALQNVNLQVGQLAGTLLKLNSDDVYHFGGVPEGAHGPGETSLIKSVGDAPFLVGDFTHEDGSRYALVVNKDFVKSRFGALQFRIAPQRIRMVSPYNGRLTDFSGEQQWLAPGQGVLLKPE
ncbi:MAG TPA: hypothetical protein P5186_23945 [Candidatus Paceibacterota bacterium]|nr:hypothetical protein [Verrucomicrobiota bacterium]HRY51113.1 hypothetical protein [Candidatus Paceibacterota bacterium]